MVYHRGMRNLLVAAFAVAAAVAAYAVETKSSSSPLREFKSVNIEVKGNKIWTPAVFIVKKGDRVKITLVNTAPSGVHAFSIEGYPDSVASVDNKEGANTKVVEFTADKAGIFRVF
jgi:FtsP/CotA-like multicopper oxidase with cupredoxin domain